jgi:hypothetical protein
MHLDKPYLKFLLLKYNINFPDPFFAPGASVAFFFLAPSAALDIQTCAGREKSKEFFTFGEKIFLVSFCAKKSFGFV